MKKSENAHGPSPSEMISAKIADLGDWRGTTLGTVRSLIHDALPDVVEEWKWMGTPVWSHNGIICTGETYKKVVKLTFAKGASVADPSGLFNASLEGNTRRAIDIAEHDEIDATAFIALIQRAAALNSAGKTTAKPAKKVAKKAAQKVAQKVAKKAAKTVAKTAAKKVAKKGAKKAVKK